MSNPATDQPRGSTLAAAVGQPPQAAQARGSGGTEAESGLWTDRWHLVRRSVAVLKRQGAGAVGQKAGRKVASAVNKRYQAWRLSRRAWVQDQRPVFLQICHAWGGGTQKHVNELMARLRAEQVRPILLTPDRQGKLLWQEFDSVGRLIWCRRTGPDAASIDRLLALIQPRHTHIHHLIELPAMLLDRLAAQGLTPDWTIHDYHAICPRINLCQPDGGYCGEPGPDGCQSCLATHGNFFGQPFTGTIEHWREVHLARLKGARRVFVPSQDVARRYERYMPGLPLAVRPHFEDLPSPSAPLAEIRQQGAPVRVAVIGALTQAKGSDVLLACAQDARERGLNLEFHVIGSTDLDRDLVRLGNVEVLGPYREADVFSHLKQAGCHLAFLPSVWPETFMFTLSVALSAGFYTCCFDLGAQADRLKSHGYGQVLPLASTPAEMNNALIQAADLLVRTQAQAPDYVRVTYPSILRDYYDFSPAQVAALGVPAAAGTRAITPPHLSSGGRNHHARLH